jgi:large subunit ribosomal protein L20
MTKNHLYKVAHEAFMHAGRYAFAGRKNRRRDLRALWITRINGAVRDFGTNYSKFMHALLVKNIIVDRKILSELVTTQPEVFKKIAETAGFKSSK